MDILFWLLPTVVVTGVAMVWVGWIGRERPVLAERSEAARERAQQRFAEAIQRELPIDGGTRRRRPPREHSTGVAVRQSRRSARS